MESLYAHQSRASWDVVVVGAGPAGSACAASLAHSDHSVLLLEQEKTPGAAANCTGIVGLEAFEVFNLPRDLIVNTIDDIKFVGPLRREVDFSAGRSLAHVVRRQSLDAALAERAVDAGAELRTGIRVVGGSRGPDGVEVRGIEVGDRAVTYHARVVVLAVGYNLSLLRAFGLEGPCDFVQGAQLLCRNRGVEEVSVFVGSTYAPGSFGWAVPLEPGWVKVGLTTTQQARTYLGALIESPSLSGLIDTSDARLRLSPIPVGSMQRCHDDRLLVVGEAAGQVKTTSNGGIYYSMLGARAAAETLDDCLRRDTLGAAALQHYDHAWREILADELSMGRQIRAAFESMSDTKLAALMWLASVDGLMDLIRDRADFDWHRPLVEDLMRHRFVGPFLGAVAS